MKILSKKSAILTAASVVALLAAAQFPRVDELNGAGNVVFSYYPSEGTTMFHVYSFGYDSGPIFVNGMSPQIAGMRVTQWGVESYPLTLVADESAGVRLSCVIEDATAENSKSDSIEAPEQLDVRCGDMLNITIEVPDGTYPYIDLDVAMTRSSVSYSALSDDYLANLDFYGQAAYSISNDYRKYWEETFEGTGIFTRDADNPNLWTTSVPMPNEPLGITASAHRRDAGLFDAIASNALRDVYRQWYNMINGVECSGETYLMSQYGDYMGHDLVSGLLCIQPELGEMLLSMQSLKSLPYFMSREVYTLPFAYITHANMVLSRIDGFTSVEQNERDRVRGQMLALRSHGYWRLMQYFAPRWQDSSDGEAYCAPLETSFPVYDAPLATMKEIRNQCYADLDAAIALLDKSASARIKPFEIDAATARGIKMRIALLCQDWQLVSELAEKILAERPLTTNEQLLSGFSRPADSWIWSASNYYVNEEGESVNGLYYWSWQAHEACNGVYPAMWQHGANAIDKELYLSMSETDVRRSLFAMPDQLNRLYAWSRWYSSSFFSEQLMSLSSQGSTDSPAKSISEYFTSTGRAPEGVSFFKYGEAYVPVQFGAQMKYYQIGDTFDEASVVFMRSEEILLSQAEAACRLGQNEKALELLGRLNKVRDPQYEFHAIGQELIDEIIRTRRIELWGEGHSWTDRKRWNLPIARSLYVSGDTNSGNWPSHAGTNISADACNGWRYLLPTILIENNKAVDVSLMNYDDLGGGSYPAPSAARKADSNVRRAIPESGVFVNSASVSAVRPLKTVAPRPNL